MHSDKHIIEKYMLQWLLDHDSLLIPELGQFDSSYQSTVIHPGVHQFVPPNKYITFTPSAKYDDGVFATYIADNEKLPVEEVKTRLKQYVSALKMEVGIERKYFINAFGTMKLTPDSMLEFIPDEEVNFFGNSYSLPSLFYRPIDRAPSEMMKEMEEEETPVFPIENQENTKTKKKGSGKVFRYVAAVALLAGTTVGIWYLASSGTFSNPKTWFSSEENEGPIRPEGQEEGTENIDNTSEENTPPQDNSENVDSNSEENTNNENSSEENNEGQSEENENYPKPTQALNIKIGSSNAPANLNNILIDKATSRYFIIAASFDKRENAYAYYNGMITQGFSTGKIIAPRAGETKYRISLSDFSSRKNADKEKTKLSRQYANDFWILEY